MQRTAWTVVVLLLAIGCRSAPTPAPSAPGAAADLEAPAPRWSTALLWARTAAEHRAAFLQTYARATEVLDELAAGHAAGTWAIATDADETVLDNSQYQKEIEERGESFSAASFAAWAERGEATALPGAIAFLEHVHALGGRIAVVTNRGDAECPATEENFHKVGLPFDVMLCRSESSRKEPRWQAVQKGTTGTSLPPLEILMWLGDNIEDFPGLDQSARNAPAEALRPFGRRYFVLPNTMYGSFLGNPMK